MNKKKEEKRNNGGFSAAGKASYLESRFRVQPSSVMVI